MITGTDATARGALFGCDVAAAVILTPGSESLLRDAGVRDSKLVKGEKKRAQLSDLIKSHSIAWAIGISTVSEINQNPHQAEYSAMYRAVMGLKANPRKVFVDGRFLIYGLPFKQEAVIQGDSKVLCIAAASIIAKHHHDLMIEEWHQQFPGYDLHRNKAHYSVQHERAIASLGLTKLHRNCAAKFAAKQLVLEF